jgi:hypothetical protein
MKKKPIAVSWMRFYVMVPVRTAWQSVKDFLANLHGKLIGGWYCEYCQKIHSRRVLKYELIFTEEDVKISDSTLRNDFKYYDRLVCSLGRDACDSGEWTPVRLSVIDAIKALANAYVDTTDE